MDTLSIRASVASCEEANDPSLEIITDFDNYLLQSKNDFVGLVSHEAKGNPSIELGCCE